MKRTTLFKGGKMNNMSMKTILLNTFGILVTGLIVLGLLSFVGISTANKAIEQIGHFDSLLADISTIEKSVLEGMLYADTYKKNPSAKALEKYGENQKNVLRTIEQLFTKLHDENLKSLLSNIKKDIGEFQRHLTGNSQTLSEDLTGIQHKILSDLQRMHDTIIEMQKNILSSNENNVLWYQSVISVLAIVLSLGAVFLAIFVAKFITKNLLSIQDAAADLAGSDGDLTKRIPVIGKNEIGRLAIEINRFIEKVQQTVKETKINGSENASVAAELSATAMEIGRRAENQASLVANTSQTAENVYDDLKDAVEIVNESEKNVRHAVETLSSANEDINRLLNVINEAGAKESDLSLSINHLQEEANGVKEVLDIISDIADQTNLLALNAAIEAARAGEHGRGFAVVADEVRQLAERTQKSLSEITATINLVIQSINDISGQMQENAKEFEKAVEQASKAEMQVSTVNDVLKEAAEVSRKSARSSNAIAEDMERVISNMRNITGISTENARSVEEIASAAEHLSNLTEELNHRLALFTA
jgi:methyl-accepting chemotaxis protein